MTNVQKTAHSETTWRSVLEVARAATLASSHGKQRQGSRPGPGHDALEVVAVFGRGPHVGTLLAALRTKAEQDRARRSPSLPVTGTTGVLVLPTAPRFVEERVAKSSRKAELGGPGFELRWEVVGTSDLVAARRWLQVDLDMCLARAVGLRDVLRDAADAAFAEQSWTRGLPTSAGLATAFAEDCTQELARRWPAGRAWAGLDVSLAWIRVLRPRKQAEKVGLALDVVERIRSAGSTVRKTPVPSYVPPPEARQALAVTDYSIPEYVSLRDSGWWPGWQHGGQ